MYQKVYLSPITKKADFLLVTLLAEGAYREAFFNLQCWAIVIIVAKIKYARVDLGSYIFMHFR